jgi:integrase
MAELINKLTVRQVTTIRKPGRHSDGGGLYLAAGATGSRSWVFLWKRSGKRRAMGLGSTISVSLIEARAKAKEARKAVDEGRDPRSTKAGAMSFGDAADALFESMAPSWRNAKHRWQWEQSLRKHCKPLRDKAASAIDTNDVLEVLQPLWRIKPETASRLRGRIERVLDFAKAHGQRQGENPARWKGHLNNLLARRQKLYRGHLKAMPLTEVPGFIAKLRTMDGIAPRALEFAILTAARSGEVRGALWDEIDLDAKLWTVPAERRGHASIGCRCRSGLQAFCERCRRGASLTACSQA